MASRRQFQLAFLRVALASEMGAAAALRAARTYPEVTEEEADRLSDAASENEDGSIDPMSEEDEEKLSDYYRRRGCFDAFEYHRGQAALARARARSA